MAASLNQGVDSAVTAEELAQAFREAGLEALSSGKLTQFETYLALLLKWNAKLNLTAIREPKAIIRRHFVECIQCAQALPQLQEGSTLLDFGSGGGLPGIPIAICRPEIQVILAESQRKKTAFLREAVRTLGVQVEVFDGRVEDMPEERRFSIVTLRAVDKMAESCREAVSRITLHGWIVVFSTTGKEAEINETLPEIQWRQRLRIRGLEKGEILFGQGS